MVRSFRSIKLKSIDCKLTRKLEALQDITEMVMACDAFFVTNISVMKG